MKFVTSAFIAQVIIDLLDYTPKSDLSFDKYWGNYHFFYTIQQTLLSYVYDTFWNAFCVDIVDYIIFYIIWAYMDYYRVRSIFSQDWSNEMVNLLIVAPLKLFRCDLPSFIELLNKFFWILLYDHRPRYIFSFYHFS